MKLLIALVFCSVVCLAQSEVPGEYPQASTQLLNEIDIADFGLQELSVMRNEIFARHGYIFKKKEWKDYFSTEPWYKPTVADINAVTAMLTEMEKSNVALIQAREEYLRPTPLRKLPLLSLPLNLENGPPNDIYTILEVSPGSSRGAPVGFAGLLPDTSKFFAVLWFRHELALVQDNPPITYYITTYTKKFRQISSANISLPQGGYIEFGASDCNNTGDSHSSVIDGDLSFASVYTFKAKCPGEEESEVRFEVSGRIKKDGTIEIINDNNPYR